MHTLLLVALKSDATRIRAVTELYAEVDRETGDVIDTDVVAVGTVTTGTM